VIPTAGIRLTEAVADFVPSVDVALTTTVVCAEMDDGAVYRPFEAMLPTAGLKDHVTAVSTTPLSEALNCWV
jgi:hypothetical protein